MAFLPAYHCLIQRTIDHFDPTAKVVANEQRDVSAVALWNPVLISATKMTV